MALAHAKVHWGKLDAEKLITEGPPEGKEHRKPELYYEGVLKGARLAADKCTKDIIFPWRHSCQYFVIWDDGTFIMYFLFCVNICSSRVAVYCM